MSPSKITELCDEYVVAELGFARWGAPYATAPRCPTAPSARLKFYRLPTCKQIWMKISRSTT